MGGKHFVGSIILHTTYVMFHEHLSYDYWHVILVVHVKQIKDLKYNISYKTFYYTHDIYRTGLSISCRLIFKFCKRKKW